MYDCVKVDLFCIYILCNDYGITCLIIPGIIMPTDAIYLGNFLGRYSGLQRQLTRQAHVLRKSGQI